MSRDINQMHDVIGFISAWDAGNDLDGTFSQEFSYKKSEKGNINDKGENGGLNAASIPPWHRQFEMSLEVDVKALVKTIVTYYDWITYTSCQGHYYLNLPLNNSERHVGILPRSYKELMEIEEELRKIINKVNEDNICESIELQIYKNQLIDGSKSYQVIDLYFKKNLDSNWREYFCQLNNVYESLVLLMKEKM